MSLFKGRNIWQFGIGNCELWKVCNGQDQSNEIFVSALFHVNSTRMTLCFALEP